LRPRTIITHIAGILSISYDRKAAGASQRGEFAEQLMFAKITSVIWICQISWVVEFFCSDDAQRDLKLLGDGHGLLKFPSRQARRIRDDSHGFFAQDLMRDQRE